MGCGPSKDAVTPMKVADGPKEKTKEDEDLEKTLQSKIDKNLRDIRELQLEDKEIDRKMQDAEIEVDQIDSV